MLFDDQVRKVWIIADLSYMLNVLLYTYLQGAFLCVKVREVEFTTQWCVISDILCREYYEDREKRKKRAKDKKKNMATNCKRSGTGK